MKNLDGKSFGNFSVIKQVGHENNRRLWLCRCACGNKIVFATNRLTSKGQRRKSCGCIENKRNSTHRKSRTKEFKAWSGMIERCHNSNNKKYYLYGGRGIMVCDRWRKSFKLFLKDMGVAPSPKHSIDRKNGNKNYSPGNCRWATITEQNRNRSNTKMIEYNSVIRPLGEWCDLLNLPYQHIYKRLHDMNWSIERAFTQPILQRNT